MLSLLAAEGESCVDGAELDVTGDDDVLAVLAGAGPRRRKVVYDARSDQLLEHARDAKKLKAAERQASSSEAVAQQANRDVDILVSHAPSLATCIGRRRRKRDGAEALIATQRLAVQAPIKGDGGLAIAQQRAQTVCRKAITSTQCAWLRDALWPDEPHAAEVAAASSRILIVQQQFDEAQQRCRAMTPQNKRLLHSLRYPKGPRGVKMFLQLGCLLMFSMLVTNPVEDECKSEPYYMKPLRVEVQDAGTITECLIRRMPLNIEDREMFNAVSAVVDAVVLQFGSDRFSANIVSLAYLFKCVLERLRPNVYPWWEPCWSHGIALAKATSPSARQSVASVIGFSKLVQDAKCMDMFRSCAVAIMRKGLRRRREVRPPGDFQRTLDVLMQLFKGGSSDDFLYTTDKSGTTRKTRLLLDIEATARHFSLEHAESANIDDLVFTHYCCIDDAADQADDAPQITLPLRRCGPCLPSACCESDDDCLEKSASYLNIMCGSGWKVGCQSRWLTVELVLKRMLASSIFGLLLPRAVFYWMIEWQLAGDLGTVAAELGRLVAANRDDYQAKTKLKLVRVAQALRQPFFDGVVSRCRDHCRSSG